MPSSNEVVVKASSVFVSVNGQEVPITEIKQGSALIAYATKMENGQIKLVRAKVLK